MPVIKKITTQKKNNERFNIFFEDEKGGEEYAFSVDQNVLIKFQLKKGLELDEFDLSEIQFDDEVKKGTNVAYQYLSHRMRSEKEVMDYLITKEWDLPIVHEIIHKLKEYKYLNDEEFSIAYVRTQMNTTDKGPEVIKRELQEKGVNPSLIEASLEEYSQEQQLQTAIKLVGKHAKKGTKVSFIEQKQKIEQALLRKGFTWNVISLALEEIQNDDQEDSQWEALLYQGEKARRKYEKFEGFVFEQKMKQALYRKGFPIELIERYLDNEREE